MAAIYRQQMNSTPIIEVCDLSVAYGNHVVLGGVDLCVMDGEFVSIVGKSGCGKSTLLLALAGFIPYSGKVSAPDDIGMVFQHYAVFPWLTVRGNIAFGLSHLTLEERERVIVHHLELVGLESHASKYPAQLSGGQAQRVALARALAPGPRVVFMDEPFGALDNFTRGRMQEWLSEVSQKEKRTILFVTHNIEEAIFLSDRILMVGDSRIVDESKVPFDRPRDAELKYSHEFVDFKKRIVDVMEQ